jgi:very-short-patch-repair endonuclease/transposase
MKNINWNEVQKYYDMGHSQKDLCKKFKLCFNSISRAVSNGDFKSRTKKEAAILSNKYRKGKPLSASTRKKLSDSLKLAHKEGHHPGWLSVNMDENRRTFPELFFVNAISETELSKKYTILEKFQFGKYVFDFAIVDLKIDIEIDGHHHFYDEYTVEKDKIRDKNSVDKGWKVYRIAWRKLRDETTTVIQDLLDYIESEDKSSIVRWEIKDILLKKRQKKKNEYTPRLKNRKVDRPSYEQLLEDLDNMSYVKVGKKYKVSDNAIRKWIKYYKKEYNL